ncbi:hydroxyisourate hydrolase [Humitalea sp. 24SJ18S-53]|uniref:hydroxyisourate hydrolase n=1 Tax=Humitalea sp. 24SJ18S-53 TaxID=3422307 RepID=UPI003D678987
MHDSILTIHVLNQAEGIPGAGITVELWRMAPLEQVAVVMTDSDGKSPTPLLPPGTFVPGRYELRFRIGDYWAARGMAPDPAYFDVVAINVGFSTAGGHYHVPLGCTPWAYSTYRGS